MNKRAVCVALVLLAGRSVGTAAGEVPDLQSMLMREFTTMNAAHEGIFREDVTSALSAFFPVGQPMAETRKILKDQKLGVLKPFKGANDPGMGRMFVTKFNLVSHVFAHVYVVLDFDFDDSTPDMKLKMMKAYLRSSSM